MGKKGKKKEVKVDPNNRLICENRRSGRDYAIADTLEAGIVLRGSEVKSCRDGKMQLKDAHVRVMKGEAFLFGAHISEYPMASAFQHDPVRTRKLLLHAAEIERLDSRIREKGLVAIPLKVYFKKGKVKVLIGVGKGRTHGDRRERIQKRDVDREMQRALKRGR